MGQNENTKKKEINKLQKKQIFISKEYETIKKMDESKQVEKNCSHHLKNIKNKLLAKEIELDNLEQYGRRKNLEFYGVPV